MRKSDFYPKNFLKSCKRLTIISFLLLILVFPAFADADSFSVDTETVVRQIEPGEFAVFDLIVHNKGIEPQKFTSNLVDARWYLTTEKPIYAVSGFDVMAGKSKEIRVYVKPSSSVAKGMHHLEFKVQSAEGDSITKIVSVELLPFVEKTTDLTISAEAPNKVKENSKFSFRVNILNNNNKSFSDIMIILKPREGEQLEAHTQLGAMEKKTVEFTIDAENEGDAYYDVFIHPKGETTLNVSKNIAVVGSGLQEQGIGFANFVERNNINLVAGGIGLVFLAVMGIILYFIFRSPVIFTKTLKDIKNKEGNVTEISIVLEIKNRSKKEIEDVRLIDKIPHLTDFSPSDEFSITPSKVLKYKQHKVVKYNIDKLEPLEDRIISYKIQSNLSILGNLSLSSAVLQYGENRKRVYSNSLNVFI